jgi:nucleoside 2-deoxyribosyltransferase
MTGKRFQLFVSSTFEDLKEERKTIQEAILRLDHFPAGMEGFPAADDSAWELIKQVIDDSDYYLLIIAGRYGSQDDQGTSYTEKEYNYALASEKPVIAFIHGDPNSLPHAYVERSEVDREKLKAFVQRVKFKHHCKFWKDKHELQVSIYPAIQQLIKSKPALGWTRQADGPSVDELNRRLVELQSKYDACRAELDAVRERAVSFDQVLSGELTIDYEVVWQNQSVESKSVVLTWMEVFMKLAEGFQDGLVRAHSIDVSFLPTPLHGSIHTDGAASEKIIAHLFTAGVINSFHRDYVENQPSGRSRHHNEVVWTLTELGKKLYYAHIAKSQVVA